VIAARPAPAATGANRNGGQREGCSPLPEASVTPPCHGCRHAARCQAERLACEAYVLFKKVGGSPERWALAPRQPSPEIYKRAYAPVRLRDQ
jgi:hypothetical protein